MPRRHKPTKKLDRHGIQHTHYKLLLLICFLGIGVVIVCIKLEVRGIDPKSLGDLYPPDTARTRGQNAQLVSQSASSSSAPIVDEANQAPAWKSSPRLPPLPRAGHRGFPNPVLEFPKVVFYVTTQLSQQHLDYLTHCWPLITQRLQLLQQADLLLYASKDVPADVLSKLAFRNITVRHYQQPDVDLTQEEDERADSEKHAGAIQAMLDPFRDENSLWFDGYDWVFRLNPVVLVRNDHWFLTAIRDPSLNVLFVDCINSYPRPPLFQTDFSVFRPLAVNRAKLFQLAADTDNAEELYTALFEDELQSGRAVKIPGVNPYFGVCRVLGPLSPVIHTHDKKVIDSCISKTFFELHGEVSLGDEERKHLVGQI